ncbi:MAG: hypothetical protein LLF93_09960 [Bacteroidales bacterium]|nr:hypothetical protein [Bacteroidales bacterium]
MTTEICKNIENLFTSNIYPNCPKKQLCDRGQEKISIKPKMPYIGRNYDNNPQIPNLLFISLDSGEEYENYHNIEEIRTGVEKTPPRYNPGKDVKKHWYQTFDIATLLLDKYFDNSIKKGVSYVDSFISHTNSAKCTQNKEGREQADSHFFYNCLEFVIKEIPLFNADIIITQGILAQNCLKEYLIREKIVLETTHNGAEVKLPICIRELNNKIILHIPMYHPSYYRGYWGHKQALSENLKRITDIIDLNKLAIK